MAEAFVKTFKRDYVRRDYVRVAELLHALTALAMIETVRIGSP